MSIYTCFNQSVLTTFPLSETGVRSHFEAQEGKPVETMCALLFGIPMCKSKGEEFFLNYYYYFYLRGYIYCVHDHYRLCDTGSRK